MAGPVIVVLPLVGGVREGQTTSWETEEEREGGREGEGEEGGGKG